MVEQSHEDVSRHSVDTVKVSFLLRADLIFDNQDYISGVTGRPCDEWLLLCLSPGCLTARHVGKKGLCQLVVGREYFEVPFEVVRTYAAGLGIKLHDDDNRRFQMAYKRFASQDGLFFDSDV